MEERRLLDTYWVRTIECTDPYSLRQAILNANNHPGPDNIHFNIGGGGGWIIEPCQPLPPITDPVNILGDTQPGFNGTPLIAINGRGLIGSGLNFVAGNSTVRSLIIGHFQDNGILLQGGSNTIVGSYIGTSFWGTTAWPNGGAGVAILSAGNTIGGTSSAERNVLSGNRGPGVYLSGPGARLNVLQGNTIGLNTAGAALGNRWGVYLDQGANNNRIGTSVHPALGFGGNVIAGNMYMGVALYGSLTTANTVQSNLIGTNGSDALPNGNEGVFIGGGANNNTIGGTSTATFRPGNIISGNGWEGIAIVHPGTNANVVQGNFIGTNGAGTAALGNNWEGILLGVGASNNLIGGSVDGARNLIAGNRRSGIKLASPNTRFNLVAGNWIGTNAAGTEAVPNERSGVEIAGGPSDNFIGAISSTTRNVISGNGADGVLIFGSTTTRNTLQGNYIGLTADGTGALPNLGNGVALIIGTHHNLIGGPRTVMGNVIAFNGGTGVQVGFAPYDLCVGNTINSNSIFENGAPGIDLGSDDVTPNDTPPPGPNNWQNYPVVDWAISDGVSTTVAGTLQSTPNSRFRLEFFANTVLDPSGFGEGEQFLGFLIVSTDAAGLATFMDPLDSAAVPGQYLTATATDLLSGDTSEFSAAVEITEASSGPASTGRAASRALSQPAAYQFTLPVWPPSREHVLTEGTLLRADDVHSQTRRPDGTAVDTLLGSAVSGAKRALPRRTAEALLGGDSFLPWEDSFTSLEARPTTGGIPPGREAVSDRRTS